MAVRELHVSEVLCFLLNKFGKVPEEKLKLVLVNFYSEDEVAKGKEVLYNHLDALQIEDLTRKITRRTGKDKAGKDVDDMLSYLNLADKKLALGELPIYVSQNLDRVPIVKPEDVDIFVLAQKVATLESKLEVTRAGVVADKGGVASDERNARVQPSDGNAPASYSATVAKGRGPANTSVSIRSASTVNAPSMSSSTGINENEKGKDPFQVVTRKQRKPKTRIVGSASVSHAKLTAAKEFVPKAVYCIDNLAEDSSVVSITDFLKELNVPVLSCFETKSWRSRKNLTGVDASKAYRLCISSEHSAIVQSPDSWPRGILVRPWKFKPQSSSQTESRDAANKPGAKPTSEKAGNFNGQQPENNILEKNLPTPSDL